MVSVVVEDAAAQRVEALGDLASIRDALRDAMATLPPSQLDAIRLRVIEEMPYHRSRSGSAVAKARHKCASPEALLVSRR